LSSQSSTELSLACARVFALSGSCFYHPDLPAIMVCNRCGRSICSSCRKPYLQLSLCPNCYYSTVAAQQPTPTGNPVASTPMLIGNPSLITTRGSFGLTDGQQAWIVLGSAILIAVGGVSVPAGFPTWVSLFFSLIGAAGFAVKEALGAKPK